MCPLQDLVSDSEQQVQQHQDYSDRYQQCRDWLHTITDKLHLCSEASPDKNSIQTKIHRIKVL